MLKVGNYNPVSQLIFQTKNGVFVYKGAQS